ncbi:MAG: hypothetical protein IK013_00155 [Bacteroidales bacterium]|nr:hypothetical protein [Bacteroidales bacterium]
MNFIKKTQNNRKTIALLVITLGFVAAKSQPIITLDTGAFIPLSSYIDEKNNKFDYWDDVFDANYMFYGKIRIDNITPDTLMISPYIFKYVFSKSNIGLFWPHNASNQILYSKSTFEYFPEFYLIKLAPNRIDTVEIFLYGEFSDYFVSLIKDFKNFPAVYENLLRKHKRFEKLIQSKCKLYLFNFVQSTDLCEVDIRTIKIVAYKNERDKYINSLWESYIKPNRHTFE